MRLGVNGFIEASLSGDNSTGRHLSFGVASDTSNAANSWDAGDAIVMLDGGLNSGFNTLRVFGNQQRTLNLQIYDGDLTVPGGRVGIGTTNPDSNLDIYDASGYASIRFGSWSFSGTGVSGYPYFGFGAKFNQDTVQWDTNHTFVPGMILRFQASGFHFDTLPANTTNATPTTRMFISNSNGNVGIGTTNPVGVLQVENALVVNSEQGGAIEIGGFNTIANPVIGGTPYLDFHYGMGLAQDYNFRLINVADNRLDFKTASGKIPLTLNDGNVGIGTANPQQLLHIANNLSGDEGTPGIFIQDPTATNAYGGSLYFEDRSGANALKMSVTDDGIETGYLAVDRITGNVGIGTTSPNEKLDVWSAAIRSSRSSAQYAYLYGGDGTDTAVYLRANSSEGNKKPLVLQSFHNGAGGPAGELGFRFETGTYTSPLTVMTIGESGNVGIGTTDPKEKLDIARGHAFHTGGDLVHIFNGYYDGVFKFGGYGGGSKHTGNIRFSPSTGKLSFESSAVAGAADTVANVQSHLSILSNGNVGIGTTAPNAKLVVAGGDIKIANSGQGVGINPNNPTAPRDVNWDSSGTQIRDTGYIDFITDSNDDSSGGFNFFTGGINRSTATSLVTILMSGNVGIGTATPGADLEITRQTGNSVLRLWASEDGSPANDTVIQFGSKYMSSATPDDAWYVGTDGTNTYDPEFKIGFSGDAWGRPGDGDFLTILTNSNVGIGTAMLFYFGSTSISKIEDWPINMLDKVKKTG